MSTSTERQNLFDALKKELSAFQRTLHQVDSAGSKDDCLYSIYYEQFKKSPWYFQFSEIMSETTQTKNGHNVHVYKVNNNAHGLLYSDICQKLPFIECKPGYTARWTANVGSNIIREGAFFLNDKKIQSMDYRYNDYFNQTMVNPSHRLNIDKNLGNQITGGNFVEKIPRFQTSYTPPWFYSRHPSSYFPLFYCGLFDKIEHHLILRTEIRELLEIRDKNGNSVNFSSESIARVGNSVFISEDMKLETPQMWGKYIMLSEEECTSNLQNCMLSPSTEIGRNIYYLEDLILLKQPNSSKLGNEYHIELKDIKAPCIRLGWVAQNLTAEKNNYYSNYSNNYENSIHGFSPIDNTTLMKGNQFIFEKMPSFRTERVFTEKHFPSVPTEPGYSSWAFGNNTNDTLISHPGIVFTNGVMIFDLKDTDQVLDNIDWKCDDYFKIFVFVVVIRKLVFIEYPKDESERSKKSVIFQISD